MKRLNLVISATVVLIAVGALYIILHSTPQMALRTHVFFMGYPKAAITSEIVDDKFHNREEKEEFEASNTKAYTLTAPPTETSTQSKLSNFKVTNVWFLHFADYLGRF